MATASLNPLAQFLAAEGADASVRRSVDRILDAVRSHLGMDIAFASEIKDGRRTVRHLNAKDPNFPLGPGFSEPLEDSFCHHILEGRLPELIHDASAIPLAASLPATAAIPIGSHLNVPLRLKNGALYGTFCCFSHTPDFSLTERDLSTVRAFADLAVDQIEARLDQDAAREATIARIEPVIERGPLTMVYQPICGLSDSRPVGVEALARFSDCDVRPPNEWFAEADEVGLGVALEMTAVREALRGLPYLPRHFYLSMNASPAAVLSGALEKVLEAAPPDRIVIEVTEHSEVEYYDAFQAALKPLRRYAKLAIDDVGAGYSGLRRILDLAPDIIKLDISLTRNIDADGARQVLAGALVGFAASIECRIVAEGIETEAEMRTLRDLGVGYGQGYHLGRPLPLVAAQQRLLGARFGQEEETPAPPVVAPERRSALRGH